MVGFALFSAPAGAATTFSTPGVQTFTVPSNATQVTIAATGAAGGQPGHPCTPGHGGQQQATFTVTPGTQLKITVGGRGADGTEGTSGATGTGGSGGTGGGGSGGTVNGSTSFNLGGGGGGGASTIAFSAGGTLLVAGGGGGCGAFGNGGTDTHGNGGDDGAPGVDGENSGATAATGGGAGTLIAGGAGGKDATPTDGSGGNGSAGQGGGGAGGGPPNGGGGGAGGGFFGGGGGGAVRLGEGTAAGGGGGSDFVAAGASNVVLHRGVGTGDGQVTITPLPTATAQPATSVTTSSATLNGIVNPNGTATTYHFEYGPTTAYGTKIPLTDASVGSDSANHSVSQSVSGLTPGTVYHYRIVATNSGGTTMSADMTLNLVAVVSGATQSSKTWRESGKAQLVHSSRKRPPLGTTFKFTLSRAASVRFDFTQPAPGRKVHGKCVAQNRHNKRKHRCTRQVVRGSVSLAGRTGKNTVRFFGWLSKHKKLKPGKYTVVITAMTPGAGSTSQTLKFTIVK